MLIFIEIAARNRAGLSPPGVCGPWKAIGEQMVVGISTTQRGSHPWGKWAESSQT